MNQTLRSFAAGAAGAVLVMAVVAAQPALADQLDKVAKKNSVNSKSIKDGSIKTKDLNAEVSGPLAKAGTALQSVPDNSVTGPKIADGSVGSADVTDNSLAATDLAPSSVGTSEVTNGSLTSADITVNHGTVDQNLASIAAGACASFTQASGGVLAGDLVLANADLSLDDGLTVSARSGPGVGNLSNIQIIVCNTTAGAINPPNTTFSWAVIEN